jgi:hypothetical protein
MCAKHPARHLRDTAAAASTRTVPGSASVPAESALPLAATAVPAPAGAVWQERSAAPACRARRPHSAAAPAQPAWIARARPPVTPACRRRRPRDLNAAAGRRPTAPPSRRATR